ncbi:MAG: hypothetical protein KDD94_05625 [Calditrichaeota bacterium]|nr:hypothetical protein [Calditrichota bacterium]
MKKKTWVILLTISIILAGCAQIGKLVGGLLTQSTDNLADVSMISQYIGNVYPKEVGTVEMDYFGDIWETGSSFVAVNFLKREGVGMYKIDGLVKVNGQMVEHTANGAYVVKVPKQDSYSIEVETVTGQKSSFELKPTYPIKIKSINGGSDIVDMNKDLVLELENPPGSEKTGIKVSLLADVAGITTWTEIGNYKSMNKLIIPAKTFQNPAMANTIITSVRTGPSYLNVERFRIGDEKAPNTGASLMLSKSLDTRAVQVSEPDDTFNNISVVEEINDFKVDLSKPNAYMGRPFSTGKTFAISSFAVRATKLTQQRTDVSSSSWTAGGYKYTQTVTTVKTRAFPQLPKERWDYLVNTLYADFERTLKANYNVNLIPVERVTAAKNYAELFPIEDNYSEVEYSGSYKNTKVLLPTSLGEIMQSVSSTFAADRVDSRLIRELGVDGLIAVTIDLEMPWFEEIDDISLTPRMSIRISGGPTGYTYGPTIYAQGVISGPGEEFDGEDLSFDFLEKTIRKDQLMDAFAKALNQLKKMEADYGYDAIWKDRYYY